MAVEGLNFDKKVAEVVRNYRVFYDRQGRQVPYHAGCVMTEDWELANFITFVLEFMLASGFVFT